MILTELLSRQSERKRAVRLDDRYHANACEMDTAKFRIPSIVLKNFHPPRVWCST